MKEGVIISPGMTGGTLVTFNIITPLNFIGVNDNFSILLIKYE
jgi:hypothetical protein